MAWWNDMTLPHNTHAAYHFKQVCLRLNVDLLLQSGAVSVRACRDSFWVCVCGEGSVLDEKWHVIHVHLIWTDRLYQKLDHTVSTILTDCLGIVCIRCYTHTHTHVCAHTYLSQTRTRPGACTYAHIWIIHTQWTESPCLPELKQSSTGPVWARSCRASWLADRLSARCEAV